MNKLTIKITITDPEILETYEDIGEDFIIEDFMDEPFAWLDGADIEVER